MIAAIVETPGGDHFFKLLGPKATVAAWVEDYQKALKGAKFEE